jgi:hypothetical protein
MKVVTNGVFAIPLIPECRCSSISQWAKANTFDFKEDVYSLNLDLIIPYRKSYDRIIRALGADLHEILLDNNIVNLNKQTWASVKDIAMPYIINWFNTVGHLPIKKNFCHTGYFTTYLMPMIPTSHALFDVEHVDAITNYIKSKYGLTVSNIPDNPPDFYNYTVPHQEIDVLYKTNENTRQLIDAWCAEDARLLSAYNLFVHP